jgi:hypothetical protein
MGIIGITDTNAGFLSICPDTPHPDTKTVLIRSSTQYFEEVERLYETDSDLVPPDIYNALLVYINATTMDSDNSNTVPTPLIYSESTCPSSNCNQAQAVHPPHLAIWSPLFKSWQ